eukprot:2421404-Pleurochrysis_carterae.AAC.1
MMKYASSTQSCHARDDKYHARNFLRQYMRTACLSKLQSRSPSLRLSYRELRLRSPRADRDLSRPDSDDAPRSDWDFLRSERDLARTFVGEAGLGAAARCAVAGDARDLGAPCKEGQRRSVGDRAARGHAGARARGGGAARTHTHARAHARTHRHTHTHTHTHSHTRTHARRLVIELLAGMHARVCVKEKD